MTGEDVSDAEIQMDLFRMMRSGAYVGKHGARDLLRDAKLDFPDVAEARIYECARQLINRLNQ